MQIKPSDILEILRRRWWVVLVTALAAAAFSFLYTRLQAPVYRSTVRLELSGRFEYGAQLTVERNLRPLAQRVRTTEVAREVDERLRLDLGADRLLSKVRAEANEGNVQIQIEVDDNDPQMAERLALEFARVFEEQHAARNQGVPQSERTVVSMLDRPTPAALVWPRTSAIVPLATALGVVLGAILAVVLHLVDDTIKTVDDVARMLGLATLAIIPGPVNQLTRPLVRTSASSIAPERSLG